MPTVEERLVSLEERLAALERRLPPAPSPALPAGTLPPLPPLPRRETEEEWWQRATQGRKPIGAEALQRMQIGEGADPNSTAAREEIERMREE